MICFYHSADLDGHCSGALVKMKYPECKMFGINYGQDFPWDKIKGEDVIMVDFCLQPFEDMLQIKEKANSFVWIDHHKSSIEESGHFYTEINGIRIDGIAACELTWDYFFSIENIPTFVSLLGRYDVGNHQADPRVLPFQYGMKQHYTDPSKDVMDFWNSLFDVELIQRIVEDGSIILRYKELEDENYAKACAFETEFEGYKCLAINKMLTNSQLFDSIWDNTKYDFMITFGWKSGAWVVSIYTDKEGYDGSKISKKYGGGGHKQASGFQCDEIPFELK